MARTLKPCRSEIDIGEVMSIQDEHNLRNIVPGYVYSSGEAIDGALLALLSVQRCCTSWLSRGRLDTSASRCHSEVGAGRDSKRVIRCTCSTLRQPSDMV